MKDEGKTVIEFCSNCETEIEMKWDVETRGYKAFCPVCGERLMLCYECQRRSPDEEYTDDCDYDSKTDTCKFNQKSGTEPGTAGTKSGTGEEPEYGKWISVNDRMPEKDQMVLLIVHGWGPNPPIYVGSLHHSKRIIPENVDYTGFTGESDWSIWGWSYYHEPEVAYWMPMPELPEGETS